MNDDTKFLLRMLRTSESKLERLLATGDSPFRVAAEKALADDIASMKAQIFDAMRPMIEAAEQ